MKSFNLLVSLLIISLAPGLSANGGLIVISTLGNTPSTVYSSVDPQVSRGFAFTTGVDQSYFESITFEISLFTASLNPTLIGELYLADPNNLPSGSPLNISFSHSAISTSLTAVTFTPQSNFVLQPASTYVFTLRSPSNAYNLGLTLAGTSFTVSPPESGWSIIASTPTRIGTGGWANSTNNYRYLSEVQVSAVPEGSSAVLLLLGGVIALFATHRKRTRSSE